MPDYVPDLTCIVRRKRRWFDPRNMGESTVICGRATVEQYLRCGYAFDWPATDNARAKAMEARQGGNGEAGAVHDNPVRVMKANRYYEGALDDDHHMAIALAAIIETRDRDAALAYRVCAETRHVTLGDKVSAAIRSGQQFRKDV